VLAIELVQQGPFNLGKQVDLEVGHEVSGFGNRGRRIIKEPWPTIGAIPEAFPASVE
jgi:hypothetical protein